MTRKSLRRLFKRSGGVQSLARQLSISASAIYLWHRVPRKRLEDVSRLTGMPAERLRPDLYQNGVTHVYPED